MWRNGRLPFAISNYRRRWRRSTGDRGRATLCGGHICMILTASGEIKVFAAGSQVLTFRDGRWHFADTAACYRLWSETIRDEALAQRLSSRWHWILPRTGAARFRRAGRWRDGEAPDFGRGHVAHRPIADGRGNAGEAAFSLSFAGPGCVAAVVRGAGVGGQDRRRDRGGSGGESTGLWGDPAKLDFRSIDSGEGSRTAAAVAASHFGSVLKVSEDGMLSHYRGGQCLWEL